MITKYYCIWFAKGPCCTAFTDLERAVRYCRGNLLSRYGVDIDLESFTDSCGHYFVKLSIPDEAASNFNAGRHLRGISVYLLKHHKDRYEPFKIGTRLLKCEYAGTGPEPLNFQTAPTKTAKWVDNAAPVVRCKNCKYVSEERSPESARKFGQLYHCGLGVFGSPKADDFCSYGKREEE